WSDHNALVVGLHAPVAGPHVLLVGPNVIVVGPNVIVVGPHALVAGAHILADGPHTSTWGIELPTDHFNALVDETSAVKSGDDYTVDNAAGLPDLVFTIGGKPYPIPASNYVVDILGPNKCALTVYASEIYGPDPSPEYPTVVLGSTFMEPYCTVHEFGKWRVGFKAINGDTPVCN
ncbi:aspartic protease, partial [Aphelenchoides avenae]